MEAIKNLILLTGCLLLFACGGGGGGSEPSSVANDSGVSDPQALPNFTVVDFVAPSLIENENTKFDIEVTIQNNGTHPSDPDLAWVLSSARPDFSTGYRFARAKLIRTHDYETLDLKPGETGVYRIKGANLILGIKGEHYVKIWVNPDKGENFDTDEDRVMSKHEILESDYSDNFSDVAVINAPSGGVNTCAEIPDYKNKMIEDNLEENDSLEVAHPIELSVEYAAVLCLDSKDVYKVNLVAGINYQLEVRSLSATATWVFIAPDNSFLIPPRNVTDSKGVTPFKASKTGEHWFAVYTHDPMVHFLDDPYSFSIRRLP